MKESTGGSRGAEQLRRAVYTVVGSDIRSALQSFDGDCDQMVKIGPSTPIHLEKRGNMLTLSKRGVHAEGTDAAEFTLKIRIDEKFEWWPTDFVAADGKRIAAEIYSGGKRLTNVQSQAELIELANTWGKSISAQKVAKELEGTL